MYDIEELNEIERTAADSICDHFIVFFSTHDYTKVAREIVTTTLSTLDDVAGTHSGRGLYTILTNYQMDANACEFERNGLKAIYRGHCYTVSKRLISHLFNDHYRATLPPKGVRYDVCLSLDGKSGINITQPPYSNYRWQVIVHKMPGSSKLIREQAERAFDEVFGRPPGSRERGA